ncbi:hypothetical protein C6P46_004581 [Rhodotorula mucilaginosa]|uniref:Mind kinetochore complex component Nnf1 n=1 Tax=Rhodotorula mucilaginosa TaxID=5537 RepID=A0A9P6W0M3_RHOMI|nr:hypothetical protein C6P46_004581 [Rhodotorula mucilaginosa]
MADAPIAAPSLPAEAAPPPAATATTPLGRRAKLTQDALFVASNKVIKVLDDKAMRQCFPPDWDEQYPDLIPGLREMVVATYKEGIPLAWNDLAQSADFVSKANELDRIGLDATVTTPSATTPRVQNAITLLRQKRLALAEQNQSTYERIATLSRTVASVERQNDEILKHFTQSVAALREVDNDSSLAALQDELVKVVGPTLASTS